MTEQSESHFTFEFSDGFTLRVNMKSPIVWGKSHQTDVNGDTVISFNVLYNCRVMITRTTSGDYWCIIEEMKPDDTSSFHFSIWLSESQDIYDSILKCI